MRKSFIYFNILIFLFGCSMLYSGDNKIPGYKLMGKVRAMSRQEIEDYYMKSFKLNSRLQSANAPLPGQKNKKSKETLLRTQELKAMPEDAVIPAEFEESQAVLVSWPAFAFDSTGAMITPYLPGIGIKYHYDSLIYVPIAYYLLDLIEQSPIPAPWKELTCAIQKESQVWIRVPSAGDTAILKEWLEKKGCPLYNYKFIISPDGVNLFWMRDCAPIGFYYSKDDSLGFIDNVYFPSSPIDDEVPALISKFTGKALFRSDLEIEGGNFMTDGLGNGFFSDIIYRANADTLGPAFKYKIPLSEEESGTRLDNIFNLNSRTVLNYLKCDGGTGHIDFYLKLLDEETILYTQYPESYNNTEFEDYKIIEKNLAAIRNLKDAFGRPYRLVPMHLPVNIESRVYDDTTCNNFNYYPRGYLNGLFVNKTYIFPSYSKEEGDSPDDDKAIEMYRKLLPGYNIVGINSAFLARGGGGIHCITMQIPVENPLRITHAPPDSMPSDLPLYSISASIRNRSGIAGADCFWRLKGSATWNKLDLKADGGIFSGNIRNTGFEPGDEIEYYFQARSNNGKTAVKPITAPESFYSFNLFSRSDSGSVLSVNPNPFNGETLIHVNLKTGGMIRLAVYDVLGGQAALIANKNMDAGSHVIPFDASALSQGVYFCVLEENGQKHWFKMVSLRK